MYNHTYLMEVDELIASLRAKCLGQEMPLRAILPRKHFNNTGAAKYISSQILFALVLVNPHFGEKISAIRGWLEATVYFLLTECKEEEQTFLSLVRVCEGSVELLAHMYGKEDDAHLFRPEVLTKERVEVAILTVLEANEIREDAWMAYSLLEKLFGRND